MIIMKKTKLLLLILLFTAIPMGVSAYTDGQIVTFDRNVYKVASAAEKTLYFLGTDGSKTGELEIPATVFDNVDVTFTVKGVEYSPLYSCTNITSVKFQRPLSSLVMTSSEELIWKVSTFPRMCLPLLKMRGQA